MAIIIPGLSDEAKKDVDIYMNDCIKTNTPVTVSFLYGHLKTENLDENVININC